MLKFSNCIPNRNRERTTFSLVHNAQTHNCLTALCPGLPRGAGARRNIHPLTWGAHGW